MSETIVVSDDGPIRTIAINRPDKKNALTGAMYEAMTAALDEVSPDLRCVLIKGVPGAFTAGNDLQDFLAAGTAGEGVSRPAVEFLYALVRCRLPLVAAVQGVAVGIGTTMLMHCDHVVAATDARLSTPFVGLGLVPEAASSLIAPRLMGQRRAFSLLVMGRPLDAVAARECGLVNSVVEPAAVDAEALKAAREIAALPRDAVAASRALIRGEPDEIIERIDAELAIFKERLRSAEARQAFEAFLHRKR
jgi:enoyl-CoA hydratase/carnithine racemase